MKKLENKKNCQCQERFAFRLSFETIVLESYLYKTLLHNNFFKNSHTIRRKFKKGGYFLWKKIKK